MGHAALFRRSLNPLPHRHGFHWQAAQASNKSGFSSRYSSRYCSAGLNAKRFSGRTVAAKPLDGSTASSRAKQNYPGGSVGKGLSIEKKAPRRTSPGTSVTSITSLKPSERAATSGKPPAKSQILGVKESNPLAAKTTSKPDSVSLSESRPLSSAPATGNAKASVRDAI